MAGSGPHSGTPVDDLGPMLIQGQPGWRPRDADRWKPGLTLALGAHLLLAVGLSLSVSWKLAQDEPAVEAELWSEIPRGAPPSVATPPPPQPVPEPTPVPKVQPTPPAEVEPPPAPKPDIVTERIPPKKKPEPKPAPKPEPKPEPKKPAEKKPEDKKRKEPKEVFDATPPKVPKKPEKADKADKDAAKDAKLAAEREALRRANLNRMMSELGGNGGSGAPGANAGPSAAYGGRIKARIKPNIVFTDIVSGNPLAKVEVRCAPDGRIMSRKLVSSSGVAAWDEAVLRAVDRTEVLPADEQGKVPPLLLLEFRPNDF